LKLFCAETVSTDGGAVLRRLSKYWCCIIYLYADVKEHATGRARAADACRFMDRRQNSKVVLYGAPETSGAWWAW